MYEPLQLRLGIWTPYGPVGPRLERGAALPPYQKSYPDTPEGRALALKDITLLETYRAETYQKKKKTK